MKIFLLCLFTILLALPKEVIFMRHANKAEKAPKGTTVKANWKKPLTEDGNKDAKNVMLFLQKYMKQHGSKDIVLYSSPFRRAISTVACFAKSTGIKIKLDRSLGEANTGKPKEADPGVWDPTPKEKGEYCCVKNECFMNNACTTKKGTETPETLEGNLGPNCDSPIRKVVKHCGMDIPEGTSLHMIDTKWIQQDGEEDGSDGPSSKWYGRPDKWTNDVKARAKYVWDYIITKKENSNKRLIIVSHGTFMQTFFQEYVDASRADYKCPWGLLKIPRTCNWNSGTMNFLRPNPDTNSKRKLLAVGERFSFTSTNDMLWLQQPGSSCKAKNTDFTYARNQWSGIPTTYKTNEAGKVIVSEIARKGEKVSGLVLDFQKKCPDKSLTTRLEYMDCTERKSKNGSPICLLAGWYSFGGYGCVSVGRFNTRRYMVFKGDSDKSAKSLQDYGIEGLTLTQTYNDNNGFWIKIKGLGKMSCDLKGNGQDANKKRPITSKSGRGGKPNGKGNGQDANRKRPKSSRRGGRGRKPNGKRRTSARRSTSVRRSGGSRPPTNKRPQPGQTSEEEANGGASGRKRSGSFVAASNLPESSNTASRLAFFFFGAFIFLGMYAVYSKSISKEESYYSLLNTNGDGSEL